MKKLFLILMLVSIGLASTFAQVRKGTLTTVAVEGAETVSTTALEATGAWESIAYQVLCTETGGDSDGTLWFMGSVDGTSYATIANIANVPWFDIHVSDTTKIAVNGHIATIDDGLVVTLTVKDGSPFAFYKAMAAGTTGDTTALSVSYRLQK
jgi:hypothetical protein